MLTRARAAGSAAILIVLTALASPAVSDDDSPTPQFRQDSPRQNFGLENHKKSPGSSGDSAPKKDAAPDKKTTPKKDTKPDNGGGSSQDTVDDVCEEDPALAETGACEVAEHVVPDDGGPEPPDEPVDAQEEAQKAADKLDLPTPTIHTAPSDPVKTLVGLETWLWIDDSDWGAMSESVDVDDTELTVTAEPSQVRWDMGEATETCAGPGRAWRDGMDADATTPCSYAYQRTSTHESDGAYDLSVVVRYRLTWECSGDCDDDSGDLGEMDTDPATGSLQVRERQTVVK